MPLPLLAAGLIGGAMAAGGAGAMFGASRIGGTDPRRQYYGGSEDGAQALQAQNAQGMQTGQATTQRGLSEADVGVGRMDELARNQGSDLYSGGQSMIGMGISTTKAARGVQHDAMGMLRDAATGAAPSQAELMLRADAERAAKAQLAMASQARGGNQAAAMRAAADAGTQMRLQAQQQAGIARAAEMAQARGQYSGAVSDYAQTDIARGQLQANLGLQQTGMGLGLQSDAARAQIAQGQYAAGIGLSREGMYLDAQQQQAGAQLEADAGYDQARAAGQQQKRDRLWQFGAGLVGGGAQVMGMGAGKG